MAYYPILPSEESVMALDINCQQLGSFPYELRLKATPAHPEKVTRVSATLGASCTFPLLLNNHTNEAVQFAITVRRTNLNNRISFAHCNIVVETKFRLYITSQVDNDCFVGPKSIQVPGSSEGVIDVIYEPCNVENVTATLTATSNTAGDFE